ncbi:MAG: hypothetical protein NTU77_01735 [Actinobacteria bacterium]|nr:hypothetical protein [Actinomycetota bacterium]
MFDDKRFNGKRFSGKRFSGKRFNGKRFNGKRFDDKCTANCVIFWVSSRRLSRRTASIGIDPSLDTSMK